MSSWVYHRSSMHVNSYAFDGWTIEGWGRGAVWLWPQNDDQPNSSSAQPSCLSVCLVVCQRERERERERTRGRRWHLRTQRSSGSGTLRSLPKKARAPTLSPPHDERELLCRFCVFSFRCSVPCRFPCYLGFPFRRIYIQLNSKKLPRSLCCCFR